MSFRITPILVVAAAAVGVYASKDSPTMRRWLAPLGAGSAEIAKVSGSVADAVQGTRQPASLASAGVRKCLAAGAVTYSDHPCPRGSRELDANGGTLSVVDFPKAAPPTSTPSETGLVKGLGHAEIDRLRDKQIEDAADR